MRRAAAPCSRSGSGPLLLRLAELRDHLLAVALLVGEGDLLAGRRHPDVTAALLRQDVGLAVDDDPAGLLVGLGDDPGHLRPGGRVGGPDVPGPRERAEQGERAGERQQLMSPHDPSPERPAPVSVLVPAAGAGTAGNTRNTLLFPARVPGRSIRPAVGAQPYQGADH